jgi:hypothetical protein
MDEYESDHIQLGSQDESRKIHCNASDATDADRSERDKAASECRQTLKPNVSPAATSTEEAVGCMSEPIKDPRIVEDPPKSPTSLISERETPTGREL